MTGTDSEHHRRRKPARVAERGFASVEQLGIVVVVALLLVVMAGAATPWGNSIVTAICQRIDEVASTSLGCASNGPSETPADAQKDSHLEEPPLCRIFASSEHTRESLGVELKKISIEGAQDLTFLVEEFSDESVEVQLLSGNAVGGEYEFDVEVVDASVAAELGWGDGDIWHFDEVSQWEAFESEFDGFIDSHQGWSGFWNNTWFSDHPDPPRSPDVVVDRYVDLSLSAEGNIGGEWDVDTEYLNDLTAKAGVGVNGSGGYREMTHINGEFAGHSTQIFEFGGEFEADAAVTGVSGEYGAGTEGRVHVTRDERGEIVELTIESVRETRHQVSYDGDEIVAVDLEDMGVDASGTLTEADTTTQNLVTLEVDASNRDIVNDHLDSNPEVLMALQATWDTHMPEDVSEQDGSFAQLLRDEATATEFIYENDSSTSVNDDWYFEVGGFGGGHREETNRRTQNLIGMNQLGAVNANSGQREWLDYSECLT